MEAGLKVTYFCSWLLGRILGVVTDSDRNYNFIECLGKRIKSHNHCLHLTV